MCFIYFKILLYGIKKLKILDYPQAKNNNLQYNKVINL